MVHQEMFVLQLSRTRDILVTASSQEKQGLEPGASTCTLMPYQGVLPVPSPSLYFTSELSFWAQCTFNNTYIFPQRFL